MTEKALQTVDETATLPTLRPRADLFERDDAFTLKLDLPGAARESVAVDVENGVLSVTAERGEAEATPRGWRREFGAGRFERRFQLSRGIDAAAIGAEYAAGVLTLTLPKSGALARRKIEIRTA